MPYKNPTDKAAWRRENAERNAIYTRQWKTDHPEAVARHVANAAIRAKEKRAAARLARPPKPQKPAKPPKPKPSGPDIGIWTWRVAQRLARQLMPDKTQGWKAGWPAVAHAVARSVRHMADRPARPPLKERVASSWKEAAFKAYSGLQRQLRDSLLAGSWEARVQRICNQMFTRKGYGMRPTIKPKEILSLLEKQQYRCAYTGVELTPENVSRPTTSSPSAKAALIRSTISPWLPAR